MFVCLFVWFFRRDLYSDFRTSKLQENRLPGRCHSECCRQSIICFFFACGSGKDMLWKWRYLGRRERRTRSTFQWFMSVFFLLLYRPYHTLLFLVDERYLLASLAGDCSPAITRLVKMASPLKRYSLGCHMLFNNIDLASSLWSKCYMYLGRKQG